MVKFIEIHKIYFYFHLLRIASYQIYSKTDYLYKNDKLVLNNIQILNWLS